MADIKEKIFDLIKEPATAVLATLTEDGRPWCRYVVPQADPDLTLWVATAIESRKVGQIKASPQVHLTAGFSDFETTKYYLQVQADAEVLTDQTTKTKVWNDMLANYFSGPTDPHYCVIKITPYRIELQSMSGQPPEVWEA